MKHLLLIFGLALCALPARAANTATVSLGWDANDPADQVVRYVVYEQTAPNVWTPVAESSTPSAVLANVAPGTHTYAVAAQNAAGESPRSASVSTPTTPPQSPANLRVITITITPG